MLYQRIHILDRNKFNLIMHCHSNNNRHNFLLKYRIIKDKKLSKYHEMKIFFVELEPNIKWMNTIYLNKKVKMTSLN